MADTKQCPDCAEQVLEAARKCRYCGYRFDTGERPPKSPLAQLLARARHPPSTATLAEVLADWDVALEAGEEVRLFRLLEVDGRSGFLLITDEQVTFVVDPRRRAAEIIFQYSRRAIAQVRAGGRVGRRTIVFGGAMFEHVVAVGRAEQRALLEALDAPAG